MKERFESKVAAKVRRNELLDACLHTQGHDFESRYTHKSYEDACRYRSALYSAVDSVSEYPADIEWPIEPDYQSKAEFDASIPSAIVEIM